MPCYTSLDTLRVALDAVSASGKSYSVERLETYVKRRK